MLKDPILQETFSSYRYGNLEGYQAARLKWEETHPRTKDDLENLYLRNTAMVDNMDKLMGICKEVSQEMQEAPLKCFFAVGIDHVISTQSFTVVELLLKKGYGVEYIR